MPSKAAPPWGVCADFMVKAGPPGDGLNSPSALGDQAAWNPWCALGFSENHVILHAALALDRLSVILLGLM